MKWWKEIGLGVYFAAMQNARRRDATARAEAGQAPIMVLFYHRVANELPNGWTIGTKTFARQIRWLQEHFDLVSLAEAQRRVASNNNRWPTVSITFDDGYADNCDFALPLLLRENIPFTYFATVNNIFEQLPFPHDVAAGQPLKPNTKEQIRALANAGVEIGGHTRTHPDLGPFADIARLEDEIVGGKSDLENLTGQPVRYFAFPFGLHKNMSTAAFRVAHSAGFAGVCSAYGGYNFPGDDAFHLQRIHGDPESIRLKNWLSVDRRKLRLTERYDPGDYIDQGASSTKSDSPKGDLQSEFQTALSCEQED